MKPSILDQLENVRQHGSGWMALCPAHDDHTPSLSVTIGDDGRTLLKCFAGCKVEDIVSAVGMTMQDLAATNGNSCCQNNGNAKPTISETYDYVDEHGKLLYQAVRMIPKDFRQRRPKPGGGWEWKLGDVKRVPYRLPELCNADPGAWVYIPEGEKDVDRLRSLGLIATCNAGGAEKWQPSFAEYFQDRKVVILPDNDAPGRRHAQQVASSLLGITSEVRIVDLPGLGDKQDVSDWLNAGGTVEDLDRLVDQSPQWEPVAEIEVDETPVLRWQSFPLATLPEPIKSYVDRSAAAIGCDPSFVATGILPALAAAIGNTRSVLLKRGWAEPAVLWGVLVGDSGSQKSPALDAATRHLKRRQGEAVEVYRDERREYDEAVEGHKIAYEDWKRNGRKKGDPPPEEPIEPICQRFYCADVTMEALAPLLLDQPRGVLLARDELSGWICGMDQYKGGRGGDSAHWLAVHGARDLVVDRKTGNQRTIFVSRAAVSIAGGIQPGTLRRVLGVEHFENGMAARLLLAMPPRPVKQWSESEIDDRLDRRVDQVFERLYQLQPDDQDEPVLLGLDPIAKSFWIQFYNAHAQRIADATGELAAVLSKLEGGAARIALVLHLVRQAASDPDVGSAIDETSIRSGITIAEWYANEAERVYQVLRGQEVDRERQTLVELIQRLGGTVTANELRRRTRKFSTNDEAEIALTDLVKAGFGAWEPVPPGDRGGRPTRQFILSESVSVTETSPNAGTEEVLVTDTAQEWEEIVL